MTQESEQVGESRPRLDRCADCGEVIQTSDWHPVATRVTGDGTVELYAFCSWRCRDRFEGG